MLKKYIAPLALLTAIILVGVMFMLPFKGSADMQLATPVFVNMPCSRAIIQHSEDAQSHITVKADGTGIGRVGFKPEGNQLKFLQMGVFSTLKCTLHIKLLRGDVVYLPAAMPFTAQGVVPTATDQKPQDSDITWRRIEGFR